LKYGSDNAMHMLRGPITHILESQRISWRSKDGYQLKSSISRKKKKT
jgi:hypothetical protein